MAASRSKGESTVILLSHLPSPVGNLHIASVQGTVYYVAFERKGYREEMYDFLGRYFPRFDVEPAVDEHAKVHTQLEQYFAGKLQRFSVKTHLLGTDFQLQVLTALRTIPYGTTLTYKAVAGMIGNPQATRAVGGAIGRNPIPVIIPCHRVIGEGGGMVGFGGGIDRKRKLLRLEGVLLV